MSIEKQTVSSSVASNKQKQVKKQLIKIINDSELVSFELENDIDKIWLSSSTPSYMYTGSKTLTLRLRDYGKIKKV